MERLETFGTWLKRRRKVLDLTQAKLGDKVGCSAAAIRKIEAEERRPSVQIAERIAEVFEVPAQERARFLQFARGYQELSPAEPEDEAPWQAKSRDRQSRIPIPLTPLIGRESDLSAVKTYLAEPETRLVTLVGPPGIGKTCLSQEIAREMEPGFRDGVFFVPLTSIQDSNFLAPLISQTLGLVETANQPVFEHLKDGIGDRQILLVLDNAEHIVDRVGPLAVELLNACPNLKTLVTSRESLRVPGEWLYPVPPLKIPNADQLQAPNTDGLAGFSAVTLFIQRARSVQPGFSIDHQNIQVISEILTQLDGLPLAIELIAARVRLMSPRQLLQRLKEGSMLQTDGMRARPARQKSLYNAIHWSYDLLTEDERSIFTRLAVFRGGFTTELADEVLSSAAFTRPVTDLVLSLLDKSLLHLVTDENGEPRLGMLMTIQQFACEQLVEQGNEDFARDQHLQYCLRLAEQANAAIHGPDQKIWIKRLFSERENYRAALEWCITKRDTEKALRLLNDIAWVWWLRGLYHEVHDWFERIRSLGEIYKFPALHAQILLNLGRQNWVLGNYTESRRYLQESGEIWQDLGAGGERGLAEAMNFLGRVARFATGDDEAAQSFLEQSYALYQKIGDARGIAMVMFGFGWVAHDRKHYEQARAWFEQSLNLFRQVGDVWGMARPSQLLGELYLQQGSYAQARRSFEEHLRIDEDLNFHQGRSVALGNLGDLHRHLGNYDEAARYYEKGLELCREHGLKADARVHLHFMGMLALHQNDYPRAEQDFIDSYNLGRGDFHSKLNACDLFMGLSAVAGGTNQPQRCARLKGAAHALLDTIDIPYASFDLAEIDRHVELAREALGLVEFEQYASEGRKLPLDQAIEYALERQKTPAGMQAFSGGEGGI